MSENISTISLKLSKFQKQLRENGDNFEYYKTLKKEKECKDIKFFINKYPNYSVEILNDLSL